MTKFLTLSVLASVFAASLASACPGGNIMQVIDTDTEGNQLVIANYSLLTGEILELNKSYRIVSVKENRKKTSLCNKADCSQLIDFDNKNIKVTFENLAPEGDEEAQDSVVIKGISIGGTVAVAKEMPLMGRRIVETIPMTKDVAGQPIYTCSKK